jgi:hypothetical protein
MPRVQLSQSDTNLCNMIRAIIQSAGSRFGTVLFVKKDGTVRRLQFQQARDNSERIVGSELGQRMSITFAENNPNMMKVWDHQKQAWRTVTLDRVLSLRVNGETIRLREYSHIINRMTEAQRKRA